MPCTTLPRLIAKSALYVIGLAIGIPSASAAVQSNLPIRINQTVSDSSEQAIPESVHPRALAAADLGPTPANTRLQGMSIRFSRTPAQEAALDQLLADQQDPTSPRYHQWLTPAQFAEQFGLAPADIAKVTAWLTSQGFTVTGVAQGGSFVTFDGTVAQAQAAFGTSIHNLSVDGVTHFANVTNAEVPNALAGVVSGITGLHDFRLKPRVHANAVKPEFTSSVSLSHYLVPGDLYAIYDMNPLLTAGINGAGVTVAVTGQVQITLSDVSAFRAAAGLNANLPTPTAAGTAASAPNNCSSGTSANCPSPNLDDLAESSLDVEWSGAMAPAATVLYVNGHDIIANAMTYAIDNNVAPIVTISYGNCEAGWGTTELNILNQLFKQANAQGQTILAASADVGATDCDNGASAIEGLTVDFPASSPYVTGMGGTMMNEGNTTGATQYWNSPDTTFNFSVGSTALTVDVSAKGYMPETTWNEDSPGNFFSATGGGSSAFFSKPAWQVETGAPGMTTTVPANGSRDVPDISLDAASVHDPFLFCYQGSCASGFRTASGNLTVAGGTSFDSQLFGGMLALIEQKIGGRVGNANPKLYAMGNTAALYNGTSASVFHDVTNGNNSNPCTAGTPNCPYGGTIGYSAGIGYDLATGWGSVDLTNLANAWSAVTALGSGSLGPNISSTALTSTGTSVAAGSSVTLTATVTGSTITSVFPATLTTTPGPTPAGTVQFLVNNAIVGSATLNASGVATYTYSATCSALGQQNMTAAYTGSAVYTGSVGPTMTAGASGLGFAPNGSVVTAPLIVNVTAGTCPYFTVAPGAATVTVAAGATIPTSTITVTPTNGFTGTVTLSASSTTTSGYLPTLSFNPATITFTSANNTAGQTTVLTLSGITADLRLPHVPGQVDSGIMLAHHSPTPAPQVRPHWIATGSGITVASLLLLVLPRKRRLGGLLVLALSAALVGGATGCGASSQAGPPSTSTSTSIYAGTYVINIIATYTSGGQVTRNSTSVTYNVN